MNKQRSPDLRVSSLQCGLSSPEESRLTPESFKLLLLKSSSLRLELGDLRTEDRASQPLSKSIHPQSLKIYNINQITLNIQVLMLHCGFNDFSKLRLQNFATGTTNLWLWCQTSNFVVIFHMFSWRGIKSQLSPPPHRAASVWDRRHEPHLAEMHWTSFYHISICSPWK